MPTIAPEVDDGVVTIELVPVIDPIVFPVVVPTFTLPAVIFIPHKIPLAVEAPLELERLNPAIVLF